MLYIFCLAYSHIILYRIILYYIIYYIMDFWNLESPRKYKMLKNPYCIHICSVTEPVFQTGWDDSENVRLKFQFLRAPGKEQTSVRDICFYFKQIDRGIVHWSVKFNTGGSTFAKKREIQPSRCHFFFFTFHSVIWFSMWFYR